MEPSPLVGEGLKGLPPVGHLPGVLGQGVVELGHGAGEEHQGAALRRLRRQGAARGVGEEHHGPGPQLRPGQHRPGGGQMPQVEPVGQQHRLVVEQLRPHGTDVPARRQGGPYHIGGELPEQKAQT